MVWDKLGLRTHQTGLWPLFLCMRNMLNDTYSRDMMRYKIPIKLLYNMLYNQPWPNMGIVNLWTSVQIISLNGTLPGTLVIGSRLLSNITRLNRGTRHDFMGQIRQEGWASKRFTINDLGFHQIEKRSWWDKNQIKTRKFTHRLTRDQHIIVGTQEACS